MANDEASVRMTVDSSQAMSENQKYTRAATETFNQLLQKSEQYAGSLKQRTQWIEREIELLKERNRLGTTETINKLYDDPRVSSKDRSRLIRETRSEGREDVEELKQVNKNLKTWVNDQKITQQKSERMGEYFTRMLPGILSADTAGGIANAGSAGLLGALGVVGVLAGIAITKELRGATTMEPAVRDYAVLTGRSMLGIRGSVADTKEMNLGQFGMTPSQYFTNYAQLHRAGGGIVNENMLGIMNAEKALGLSRQTTAGLMGVERYGGGRVTNIEAFFEKYLRSTSQSIAVLPEILQSFTVEASRMVRTTGRVDTAAIAASIAAVSKGFGLKGEPLQTVYGAMSQGLQQSTNPAIQAMQYSAMERSMPGASLLQMQMAMENPMENPRYVVNMLNMLRKVSGGDRSLYTRNILGAGLAPSMNLAWEMSGSDLTLGNFTTEAERFKKTGVGGFGKRAAGVTGATEEVAATIQGGWERTGFNNVQTLAAELSKLLDGVSGAFKETIEIMHQNNEIAATQIELAKESVGILKKLWHYNQATEAMRGYGSQNPFMH